MATKNNYRSKTNTNAAASRNDFVGSKVDFQSERETWSESRNEARGFLSSFASVVMRGGSIGGRMA